MTNVRSLAAVVRTIANAGVAEFPSAWVSPFVLKLSVLVALSLIWVFWAGPSGSTGRFFLVMSDAKAWTLVVASFMTQFLIFFPVAVFLAEALGRRRGVTPVAGTLVVLGAIGLLLGLVVWPASVYYLRYESWRHFANASVPEPTFNALYLRTLSLVTTALTVAWTWVLFVFANRVRRVGGATGWFMGFGILLASIFLSALIPYPPLPELRVALMLSQPPLTLAAILWATSRLARIEARRAAAASDDLLNDGVTS